MLTDGDVKTRQRQNDINNQIVYELEPGEYSVETLEAYTFKFLKVIALEGDCEIEDVYPRICLSRKRKCFVQQQQFQTEQNIRCCTAKFPSKCGRCVYGLSFARTCRMVARQFFYSLLQPGNQYRVAAITGIIFYLNNKP